MIVQVHNSMTKVLINNNTENNCYRTILNRTLFHTYMDDIYVGDGVHAIEFLFFNRGRSDLSIWWNDEFYNGKIEKIDETDWNSLHALTWKEAGR